ncbi:importin 9, putative [Ichthyophthirius multifiliis]|uniref:Importin 9, putative n=1 Tax=Ichthyophthirius multifiliis TaxID=5932 RepID=G0QZ37_ICHMU|nr:importin 9, putative [Ichthyophthirius multifiliis]EGR29523.1 importin 9, putative [Ichthyophthirius multifiliis]|eukprot:XP_004030759.1 importin 9, putative [Ichthyophthirius multifiliis]
MNKVNMISLQNENLFYLFYTYIYNFFNNIALIISDLIFFDGVQLWTNSLIEIIQWIPTQEIQLVDTGLEFFSTLFSSINEKYIQEKILPEQFSLAPIIPSLLLSLFHIFANPELNEDQRVKLIVLLYMIVGSFAWADDLNNQLVSQCFDDTFEAWINLFMSALKTNPKSHIKMKIYILKILNIIYRDFTYYSRKSISSKLIPIWSFFNSILPLYMWNCVYNVPLKFLNENIQPIDEFWKQKEQKDEENISLGSHYLDEEDEQLYQNDIYRLTLNCIQLISTLAIKETFYQIIKIAVYPLINALSNFIFITKDIEQLYIYEPTSAIIVNEEDEYTKNSIRNQCIQLLFSLIDKYKDETVLAIFQICENFIMGKDSNKNQNQELINAFDRALKIKKDKKTSIELSKEKFSEIIKNSGFQNNSEKHLLKQQEAALYILGSFSDDIIVFCYRNKQYDILQLIKYLIKTFNKQENSILISRALWCISRYSEIIGAKDVTLFLEAFKITQECIFNQNNQAFVLLVAIKSLGIISHKIHFFKNQLMNSTQFSYYGIGNVDIIHYFIQILDIFQDQDTVLMVLDSLQNLIKLENNNYSVELASVGANYILKIFTLLNDHPGINKCVMNLLVLLVENPMAFRVVFEGISPFILDSFQLFQNYLEVNPSLQQIKQYDINLMIVNNYLYFLCYNFFKQIKSILEIINIFINYCKNNSDANSLMQLLNPLIQLMILNEENTLQQNATICLKSFLKIGNEYIFQNNLIQDMMKVIMKLLQIPLNSQSEVSSTYSGNLCIIAFHKLLGGNGDPDILRQIVYKIFRSKLATTVQGLVLVWARLINNNALEAVNFLSSFSIENRPAIKVLIDKWLLQQPVFRGRLTKNTTFLALSKLFLLKDKRIENLLAIAYNPSHSNVGNDVIAPYKILSTLIRGLDNEMGPQQKKEKKKEKNQLFNQYDKDRLEVQDDDQFEEEEDEDEDNLVYEKLDNEEKIEVDLNIIQDEEDNNNNNNNNTGENKTGGLGEFEIGSTNYMTEGFAFGYDDGEECDETTEEDLIYLNDEFIDIECSEMLKKIFNQLTAQNNIKYFTECLRKLLREDIMLLKKHVMIKNLDQLQLN